VPRADIARPIHIAPLPDHCCSSCVVDAEWLTEQVAALAKKWSRKPAAKRAPGLTARYSPDAHTWPAQRFTELALCVADAGIQIDGRVWNAASVGRRRHNLFHVSKGANDRADHPPAARRWDRHHDGFYSSPSRSCALGNIGRYEGR
jgi:hypothetical protein